ncbi:hypothetical protein [Pseudobutyrivibrio sp.]|jgi:ABC-2 type transport system permease protein|uniref:hypothetical protein n=1 Tax=Pseudobutyrivibrio sp. TaxID=2014367 RepID=UPI001DDB8356|nr:hypothetical protein [Pseudobutyrivibrio sp.]MBE5910623.1 hypothetical protein [Pseudobutyrivibrio sp.]
MQSKTSFFNKALFKKNLGRTWVVGLLYFIVMLVEIPISYVIDISNFESTYYVESGYTKSMLLKQHFSYISTTEVAFVLGIVLAVITFLYLFTKRDTYMMHAFPVSRKSLYFTGLLSCLLVAIVPILLIGAITSIVATIEGAGAYAVIWYWVLIGVVSTVLFLSIAFFSLMVSGQVVTAVVFYIIFNYLYTLMQVAFRLSASIWMFGMSSVPYFRKNAIFSPIFYIADNCRIKCYELTDDYGNLQEFTTRMVGGKYLIIYGVVAVVFFIVAYIMYKFKKIETVHDFICAPFMQPVFSVGMSFFISMVAGAYISGMYDAMGQRTYSSKFAVGIISAIIIGAILYMITKMMIEKTIRVFNVKNISKCLLYSIASLAFLLCLRFDVFKVENRVPSTDDIAWVGIQCDYTMVFTSEDEINTVRSLHKNFLADKKELRDISVNNPDVGSNVVTIKYKLKNGNVVVRSYNVIDTEDPTVTPTYVAAAEPILDFLNNPTIIKEHIIGNIWNACTIPYMQFIGYRYDEGIKDFNAEEMPFDDLNDKEKEAKYEKVYEALLKDIDQGNVLQTSFGYRDDSANLYDDFNFTVSNKKIEYFSDEMTFEDYDYDYYYSYPQYEQNIYVMLNKDCTNTLQTLKDEGFYYDDEVIITFDEYNEKVGYYDYETYL